MNQKPTIAVCGIGQMGAAAVVCFSRAGFPILVWARSADKLAELEPKLEAQQRFLDEHIGPSTIEKGSVRCTSSLSDLHRQGDFILECVSEDLDQKAALFRDLLPAMEQGAILASCTSGLSVSEMGKRSGAGRRLVAAHFWNPPHLMPLVEVVAGEETEHGLVERTSDLLRQAGKIPVICKDVPGFIGNRLMHALWREAIHLVQEGVCTARDIDLVTRLTFALRLPAVGPFENMDLVGLELLSQIQSYLLADLSTASSAMPLVEKLKAEGKTGMRAGEGFHSWDEATAPRLIAARNQQIVRQLQTLKELGRL
jgi:3-hydroxybutyryl-CoA dehydrogenase